MNDKKVDFIICTNDELILEECINYIYHLEVPENYEIDVLTIKDAHSMTSGYNEGMRASDAKYKVYMHQDVFILNRHFLRDIINIFSSDSDIGLIGMVGYENVSISGVMWHEERTGTLYPTEGEVVPYKEYHYSLEQDGYSQVAVVDGLMMVTSRDLPWNESELDGWDFYDAYQSLRFLENGYKVVVPVQKNPWCLHDDGHVLNMLNYDKYRRQFLVKYKSYLGKTVENIAEMVSTLRTRSRVAKCILTYNHPEAVDDVLQNCAQDYYDYGIDVYYYDGSENEDTENVVRKYIDMGYSNIHYYHIVDQVRGQRTNMVYKAEGILENYDYIWPSKDRSYCKKECIAKILEAIETDADIVFIGHGQEGEDTLIMYDNPGIFYKDWGWLATSIDTTIFKKDSIIDGESWDKYPSVFGKQYLLLFDRLASISNPRVCALIGDNVFLHNSKLAQSVWKNNILKIWGRDWIFANEFLPDVYDKYKETVIKHGASLPWILGGTKRLQELHKQGILVPDALESISDIWNRLSDIPFSDVEKIANGEFNDCEDFFELKNEQRESIQIMVQLVELLSNKKMDVSQIPIENIKQIISADIGRADNNTKKLLNSCIDDVFGIIEKYEFESIDVIKIMKILTVLMYMDK